MGLALYLMTLAAMFATFSSYVIAGFFTFLACSQWRRYWRQREATA